MCAHLHHTGKAAPALCVYVSVLVPVTNGPPLYALLITFWTEVLRRLRSYSTYLLYLQTC